MCTLEKRGNIYILTLTGDDEHRFNPTLLDSISAALHRIKSETTTASSSAALITTAQGKFFSNGYDLKWALAEQGQGRPQILSSKLRSVIRDLISLPMPTIAAVSGHASAGGIILALSHDYVLMRKDRGFLYMSELDIGLKVPAWFVAVLKCKIGSPAAWRDIVLRAGRIPAETAVQKGIIESAHVSAEETVRAAVKLGEELVGKKWKGHVYAQNRLSLFADVLAALNFDETVENVDVSHFTKTVSRL